MVINHNSLSTECRQVHPEKMFPLETVSKKKGNKLLIITARIFFISRKNGDVGFIVSHCIHIKFTGSGITQFSESLFRLLLYCYKISVKII